jgi:hypothetical protein
MQQAANLSVGAAPVLGRRSASRQSPRAAAAPAASATRAPEFTTKLFTKESVSIAGETECAPAAYAGNDCACCSCAGGESLTRLRCRVQVHCARRTRQVRPAAGSVGGDQDSGCDRLGLAGAGPVAEHPRHARRVRPVRRQGCHRPAPGFRFRGGSAQVWCADCYESAAVHG